MGPGTLRDLLAMGEQLRKRAWTSDPTDPNYSDHWGSNPIRAGENVAQAFPGAATINGRRTPVTIRIADDANGPAAFYIDFPKVQAVGPVARLAQGSLRRNGLQEPLRIDAAAGVVTHPEPDRLQIDAPNVTIRARTDGFLGRPSTLSPREQIRQAWRFARG